MKKPLYGAMLRIFIAMLLATALWIFVSFTENPQQSEPFTNLPVQIEGLAPNLTLVDANGMPMETPDAVVNLSVAAPRDVLEQFGKQDIQPYINLAAVGPGSHEVVVQARALATTRDITFYDITPDAIPIEIEQIITATVPLSVTTQGQPPTSYEASSPIASLDNQPQKTITVVGPSNKVQQVRAGEVTLDLSSQTSSLDTRRQVIAVDVDGRKVDGVDVLPESVQIQVQILSSSGIKRVPIVYVVRDSALAGLRPLITLNPAFVSIVGSSQVLADVEFIETQPIELLGATSDFTTTVRLRFPSGVTPRDAQAAETTVATVRLIPIEVPFTLSLPVVARNLPANTTATIEPTLLEVEVTGSLTVLQHVSNLTLVLDVAGRAPGTYTLVPGIDLPAGLALLKDIPPVTVTLRSTITPTVPVVPTNEPVVTPAPISPTLPLSTPTTLITPSPTP